MRQIDKCSSKASPPSKIPPTKQRRKKGDGTGYIYRRTITRKGKQYEEFYYRYRDESSKLRSKYIPQRLLNKVEESESLKLPVADVWKLLGGDEISRGEQFNTVKLPHGDQHESISLSRGERAIPPSKKRRKQGYGGGYIECKPIKRNGKEYKQYWYHYEFWEKGNCIIKKCRYISKHLVTKVHSLEAEKAPVRKILKLLGVIR
jgi:hypothetical protein